MPKVHKSKLIAKEIENQNSEVIVCTETLDLKVRPIVAGVNCPTRNLSELLDQILKPLLKHVKSYLKDTIDFLNKFNRKVKQNTILATFDVSSLYTSIPHELGLKALKFFLEKFPDTVDKRFSKEFILEASNFVLKNNTFEFNNENYIQLLGSAMGTIFAPTYATLVMAYLETILYDEIERKFGKEVREHIEKNWFRFLDDCFIALDADLITPEDLLKILNELDTNIKFTMESSDKNVPFLDVMVNKEEGNLWTTTYSKPTDAKRYVPFDSCHPKQCLKNIPFSLARRTCMIVEKDIEKEKELNELSKTLLLQKYPKDIIQKGIEMALEIPQQDLRKNLKLIKKKISLLL